MRPLAIALLLCVPPVLLAAEWPIGARVIVEKAGAGQRAIVLRSEASRSFVAYEGVDEIHDEWVESDRIRSVRPPPSTVEDKPEATVAEIAALPVPEPLPHALELPRVPRASTLAEIWLEQLARKDASDPVRFNVGALPVPQFRFGEVAGIATTKAPLRTALVQSQGSVRGFAAIEDGIVVYQRDAQAGFVRVAQLDLSSLQGFAPEQLVEADFNRDHETDLVVTAGPIVQVYFGAASGLFTPSAQAYRAKQPVRGAAPGRFFTGPLSAGVAVIEGFNSFSVLRVAQSGVTTVEPPYELRFDRLTRLATGDFDGDGFTDVAVTTQNRGRSTGAWMFFNQRGPHRSFLWPVGGRDDFARDIAVADLDRDGRDDLILTDSDVEQGEHVRVVFRSAGRAGWEDPWELISSEYGIGLGTASITVADFNRDGRPDIGIGGRNGLRVYLGADYRRFSRNPVWPRLAAGNDFPEQRVFLAGDFDGDGSADLLGYTPAFATGYNLVYNATPATLDGLHVPAPVRRRAPMQASSTVAKVETGGAEEAQGVPRLRFLASRAEPYGQWRYRIVVEIAALADGVIEAVEATCKLEGVDAPVQEVPATARRTSDQQWSVEVILPRGRSYEFHIRARDDQGRQADAIRVTVNP
ncbi:MAG: hypothetical protein C0518_00845 [Opitutus sp.]|nr:hypothetical protein [Opitutus sp.]